MINPHVELKEMLDTVGPTYYEHFVEQGTPTPFISYAVDGNKDYLPTLDPVNDTMRYSRLEIYMKVWGKSLKETLPLYEKANEVMINNGFIRTSYTELPIGSNICLIGLYKALGLEKGD